MLNFSKYQNSLLPRPSIFDYSQETKEQFVQDLRNCVLTNQQVFVRFKKDLFEDMGIESTPDTEEFFQTAVEFGTTFLEIKVWMDAFLDSQSIQEDF